MQSILETRSITRTRTLISKRRNGVYVGPTYDEEFVCDGAMGVNFIAELSDTAPSVISVWSSVYLGCILSLCGLIIAKYNNTNMNVM